MSFFHVSQGITRAAPGGAGVVTISNEARLDIANTFRTYHAGLRYNLDGTLDGRTNLTYTQVNNSTDWIIPNNTSEDEDYEIRFTGYTGFGPSFSEMVEDIWEDIDGPKEVRITDVLSAFESQLSTYTIEVRINGGAVIDSGSMSLQIENLGF